MGVRACAELAVDIYDATTFEIFSGCDWSGSHSPGGPPNKHPCYLTSKNILVPFNRDSGERIVEACVGLGLQNWRQIGQDIRPCFQKSETITYNVYMHKSFAFTSQGGYTDA